MGEKMREFDPSELRERSAEEAKEIKKSAERFSWVLAGIKKDRPDLGNVLGTLKKEQAQLVAQAGSKFDEPSARKFLETIAEQMQSVEGRLVDVTMVQRAKESVIRESTGFGPEHMEPTPDEIAAIEEESGIGEGQFISGETMNQVPERMQEQLSAAAQQEARRAASAAKKAPEMRQ